MAIEAGVRPRIEAVPFEGARFRVTRHRTGTSYYCVTEAQRDALVESIRDISPLGRCTVTDLSEEN